MPGKADGIVYGEEEEEEEEGWRLEFQCRLKLQTRRRKPTNRGDDETAFVMQPFAKYLDLH